MIAIRKILAPTDFTHHSEAALQYACGLAERLGATLCLAHAVPNSFEPVGPEPMLIPTLGVEDLARIEEDAEASLRNVLRPEWGTPPAVEYAVRSGEPVAAVAALAAEIGADLIVLATHGRTGLIHALLGSSAERMLREAPCPVLVVRDRSNS